MPELRWREWFGAHVVCSPILEALALDAPCAGNPTITFRSRIEQSLHVRHETSSLYVAGHTTTFRPFGVAISALPSTLAGRTATTGAIPKSASASACARLLPLRLIVNPFRFAHSTTLRLCSLCRTL